MRFAARSGFIDAHKAPRGYGGFQSPVIISKSFKFDDADIYRAVWRGYPLEDPISSTLFFRLGCMGVKAPCHAPAVSAARSDEPTTPFLDTDLPGFYNSRMTKAELHELVDRLPEGAVDGAAILLEEITDGRIDPEQAWFWTREWQAKEREADDDVAAGRGITYVSDNEFLAALDERTKPLDADS